jgi:DUF4097 and DUF4098 domain-containing protein YvlB
MKCQKLLRNLFITVILIMGLAAPASAQNTMDYPARGGQKLEIDLESGGSVDIQGWNQQTLQISHNLGGNTPIRIDVQQTANGYRLTSDQTGSLRNISLHFSIRVPKEFDIDFKSRGGGLEIDDLAGRFTGKTMGGSLVLNALSGEADLTTMGGEITLTKSDLDGEVKTMGGKVEVRDVVGDVEVSSMGGVVNYFNVRDREGNLRGPRRKLHPLATVETVQQFTMGGSIEINEAPDGVDVETMGGSVNIKAAERFVNARTGGGDMYIQSNSGPVAAWTGGGDIEVEANDGGIQAFTGAGAITVKVSQDPGTHSEAMNLQSGLGEIVVELPPGFSGEFDVEIRYTRSSDQDYQIVSDFGLNIRESLSWELDNGQQMKYITGSGIVGSGGRKVKIRTTNANVFIRSR